MYLIEEFLEVLIYFQPLSFPYHYLVHIYILKNVVQNQFKPFASMTMEKNDDASFFSFTESSIQNQLKEKSNQISNIKQFKEIIKGYSQHYKK